MLGHRVEAKFARMEVGSYQSRRVNCCGVVNEFGMILVTFDLAVVLIKI